MDRRQFLGTTALGGITATAGCSSLFDDPTYTLWFVRVRNGMRRSIDISISVQQNTETVFSEEFTGIAGIDADRDDPSYADRDSVRFITGEWAPEPTHYSIEHDFYDEPEQHRVDDVTDIETEHIGLEISIRPGAGTVAYTPAPFESAAQVRDFFDEIGVEAP